MRLPIGRPALSLLAVLACAWPGLAWSASGGFAGPAIGPVPLEFILFACVLLGIASELSVPFVGPSYKIAVAFALLLLVLLLRPRGLFGKAIAAR